VRVDQLEAEGRIETTWLPFELRPDTPREGAPYPPRAAAAHSHLDSIAAELGLVMRRRDRLINTRLALSTAEFARERGAFDLVHRALLKAHWEGDAWLDQVGDLVRIGADAGLDPNELEETLTTGRYESLLDEYRADASAVGINAIPAHIVGEKYLLVGAQPYETFLSVIEKLRAPQTSAS
jgi:predicted DsbA family dithiol-disulfide isomerase